MKTLNWDSEFKNLDKQWKIETMLKALSYLDNPHLKLKNVIHIAGTNGKGSTANYIKTVLELSGFKVGIFTSPHLIEYNERIHFNGRNATDEEIEQCRIEILKKCKNVEKISFFEATTLITIMLFYHNNLDYCIFETGLGGRTDATNIFEKPLASVITSISFDHMQQLGDTLEKIANEKAGIIKPNVPIFTNNKSNKIIKVLKNVAAEKKAPFYQLNKDFFIDKTLKPSLLGKYQLENATLAKAVCEKLGINKENIYKGISNTIWPGRLQEITLKNIHNKKNNILKTYLDGAHNEDGIRQLIKFVIQTKKKNKKCKIIGVFSVLKRKDYKNFFPLLKQANFEKMLFFNEIPDEKNDFVEPKELEQLANKNKIKNCTIKHISNLEDYLLNDEKYIIFLFGSLHFVGYILEYEI